MPSSLRRTSYVCLLLLNRPGQRRLEGFVEIQAIGTNNSGGALRAMAQRFTGGRAGLGKVRDAGLCGAEASLANQLSRCLRQEFPHDEIVVGEEGLHARDFQRLDAAEDAFGSSRLGIQHLCVALRI